GFLFFIVPSTLVPDTLSLHDALPISFAPAVEVTGAVVEDLLVLGVVGEQCAAQRFPRPVVLLMCGEEGGAALEQGRERLLHQQSAACGVRAHPYRHGVLAGCLGGEDRPEPPASGGRRERRLRVG